MDARSFDVLEKAVGSLIKVAAVVGVFGLIALLGVGILIGKFLL